MSGDHRLRLFVALELPPAVLDAIEAWRREELGTRGGLRHVRRDALHVTLAFLGWRSEADAGAAGVAVLGAARAVEGLTLREPLWLPRRAPRVLALELGDAGGGLAALRTGLVDLLASSIGFEDERRPFRPHVTVARVPSGARAPLRHKLRPPSPVEFSAAAVTLFRSELRSSGARYTALARAALD